MGRAFVVSLLWLTACGVSGKKPVGELTGDDVAKLCAEEDEYTFTCALGEGYTVTFGTDCESMSTGWTNPYTADCSATVADYRICRQAYLSLLQADDCASVPEVECAFQIDCLAEGS
jgi:hypothetical protein